MGELVHIWWPGEDKGTEETADLRLRDGISETLTKMKGTVSTGGGGMATGASAPNIFSKAPNLVSFPHSLSDWTGKSLEQNLYYWGNLNIYRAALTLLSSVCLFHSLMTPL